MAILHDRCSSAPVLSSRWDEKGPGPCARRSAGEPTSPRHPGPEPVPGTLTTPHPHNQPRTRVQSIDHPPPPQSLGCAQRPTSLHSPSPQPVPRAQPTPTHPGRPRPCSRSPSPQPVPRAPTSPRHPSPEPVAPRQTHWFTGSGPRTLLAKCRRKRRALSGHPSPHFSFLGKRRRACFPGRQKLQPRVLARAPLLPHAPRSALGRRVPPHVPRRSVASGKLRARRSTDSPGSAARPPRTCRRLRSARLGSAEKPPARLGSRAWAGSGGGTPGSRGHRRAGTRRATRGLAPGPCPGVGEGRLSGGAGLRSAGPSPSRPSAGPAGTRGTARPELATPHGLRAARGAPRRSRGPETGNGGRGRDRRAGRGPGPRGTHCSRR